MSRAQPFDFIGVGLGPSNLSLAALADTVGGLRPAFFEQRSQVEWHDGMLLPRSELQVSYLKDLVTLVDPTNPHSFLNFLAETGRLHRFLVVSGERVTRREFTQYYRWVARRLPSVSFGSAVREVRYAPDSGFRVRVDGAEHRAPVLVLGTGRRPRVPAVARPALGRDVLHSADFLRRRPATAGRRVVVVGGGQSGAELVAHLLEDRSELPASLTWTSRRHAFVPLDDSPFANEWFNPRYVEYFRTLPAQRRHELVALQCYASDGISADLLARIYRRLYELDYVDRRTIRHRLLLAHELIDVVSHPDAYDVVVRNADTGGPEVLEADVVILATGYEAAIPEFVAPLLPALDVPLDDGLDEAYRVPWDGAPGHAVHIQNGGRLSHGVADANLSLASWRAATILNAICGRPVLRTERGTSALALDLEPPAPAEAEEMLL